MCSLDNKIIVLNRHGWINLDRILFYNYEVQYKDNGPMKFCSRKEIMEKYTITTGGIACLINDGKTGKDTSKRYKYKDFKIRQIRRGGETKMRREKASYEWNHAAIGFMLINSTLYLPK